MIYIMNIFLVLFETTGNMLSDRNFWFLFMFYSINNNTLQFKLLLFFPEILIWDIWFSWVMTKNGFIASIVSTF